MVHANSGGTEIKHCRFLDASDTLSLRYCLVAQLQETRLKRIETHYDKPNSILLS